MSPNRPRHLAVAAIVAAGIVVIDQATKAAALATLSEETRIPLLGDLFGLQLAFNPGAILSLGSGFTGVLTLVGAGAVVCAVADAIESVGEDGYFNRTPIMTDMILTRLEGLSEPHSRLATHT